MIVAFKGSGQFGFERATIAFEIDGITQELFDEEMGLHPGIYLFVSRIIARCPPGETLTLRNKPVAAVDVLRSIENYAADGFAKKPKAYRDELKALYSLMKTRGITLAFEDLTKVDESRLAKRISAHITGRGPEKPLTLAPGDPREELLWKKDRETIAQRINRALAKDR
jgi:hypothetical protein